MANLRASEQSNMFSFLLKVLLCLSLHVSFLDAALPCTSNYECHHKIHNNSECMHGFCSNPYQQGCLRTVLGNDYKKRICNSDDGNYGRNSKNHDNCFTSFWNYTEIRIHHGNWETSIFYAWILQILLMEVLEVPITVGLNTGDTLRNSFYSPNNTLEYSSQTYPFAAMKQANEFGGDCSKTTEPCTNVMPEVFIGQLAEINKGVNQGYLDKPLSNGQVGSGGWYIPVFTAERDDTLVSYYGLSGEENRHKLAAAFPRPISYGKYCDTISTTNCSDSDTIASRYPLNEAEHQSYFIKDVFEGHFVHTDKNNCTKNPTTCTGHFVSPPCTWSINVDAQIYWNGLVGLEVDGPLPPNGGYSYSHLVQIWRAANATKTNVITNFYQPEPTVEEFKGTDAEYQRVLLPTPYGSCITNQPDSATRCSDDIWVRRHIPESACDVAPPQVSFRIMSSSIATEYFDQNQDEALKSPAYGLMRKLQVTDLVFNDMLRDWISLGVDRYGQDARQVVCEYVANNLEALIKQAVPLGYPRKVVEASWLTNNRYGKVAQVIGIIMIIIVLLSTMGVVYFRKEKVFVFAQIHFVLLILLGSIFICLGALSILFKPSLWSCTATEWFVLLGYTGQLVPLLVKITAIQTLFRNAKKMKRVQVSPVSLFKNLFLVMLLVITYLIVWTIIDPPHNIQSLFFVDNNNRQQDLVEIQEACGSESSYVWHYVSNGWLALWLICAGVLAFQTRNVRQEFNESTSLATLVYTHVFFLGMQLFLYVFEYQGFVPASTNTAIRSCLLSVDATLGMCVYLVPKFLVLLQSPKENNTTDVLASVRMRDDLMRSFNGKISHHSFSLLSSSGSRAKSDRNSLPSDESLRNNSNGDGRRFYFGFSTGSLPEPMLDGSDDDDNDDDGIQKNSHHDMEQPKESTLDNKNDNDDLPLSIAKSTGLSQNNNIDILSNATTLPVESSHNDGEWLEGSNRDDSKSACSGESRMD